MTAGDLRIGLLGAGEMGAGLARQFAQAGASTFAVPQGRSEETLARMEEAGMIHVPDRATLVEECDLLFSVLPPDAAENEARLYAELVRAKGSKTIFVEANAIAPQRTRRIADLFEGTDVQFVDGGIVGPPPTETTRPRFYVSGPKVHPLERLDGGAFDLVHLGPDIGQASAFKMVYAAMTKGSNALLTAGYLAAEQHHLLDAFLSEFGASQPALHRRAEANIPRLPADAGRWVYEMQEIASTFRAAGLPGGFHDAAASIMELLANSEFGSETRRTRDRNRTAKETVRAISGKREK